MKKFCLKKTQTAVKKTSIKNFQKFCLCSHENEMFEQIIFLHQQAARRNRNLLRPSFKIHNQRYITIIPNTCDSCRLQQRKTQNLKQGAG